MKQTNSWTSTNSQLVLIQSCLTLCNPMDYSLPGSSVHGISQARTLECVAISSFRDLPNPGIKPTSPASSALAGGFFTTRAPPGKPDEVAVMCHSDVRRKW